MYIVLRNVEMDFWHSLCQNGIIHIFITQYETAAKFSLVLCKYWPPSQKYQKDSSPPICICIYAYALIEPKHIRNAVFSDRIFKYHLHVNVRISLLYKFIYLLSEIHMEALWRSLASSFTDSKLLSPAL